MMPQTPSTTPEQRASIEKVLNILQDLRAQRSAMTVSQAIALLQAVLHEGQSVGDLAKMMNIAQSALSRHLSDLDTLTRSKEPGAGLVHLHFDLTRCVHVITLTEKGVALVDRIVALCGPSASAGLMSLQLLQREQGIANRYLQAFPNHPVPVTAWHSEPAELHALMEAAIKADRPLSEDDLLVAQGLDGDVPPRAR
jgi:DNA-binding MarR family transcriptional regulator